MKLEVIQETLKLISEKTPVLAASSPPLPIMSNEDRIVARFEGGATNWANFSQMLKEYLGATPADMEVLEDFLKLGNNTVNLATWNKFSQWFSPLSSLDNPNPKPESYNITEMVGMIKPAWFHGFLSPEETAAVLKEGQFLIRFSSHPGHYTVSTRHGGVYHMRVSSSKQGKDIHFIFEGLPHTSLEHIVSEFCSKSLPGKDFNLGSPCNKKSKENLMNSYMT